jgi:adenylosuccinate synthase
MSVLSNKGVTVVLGAQWGDEGKGKLSDILCGEADVCARCQVNIHLELHFI